MNPESEPNPTSPSIDIAIIGAGAAGLAAAIFAAEECDRRGVQRSIALIDGAKKPGAKILVSGGGRCNVTNVAVTEQDYCGGSPNIIRNVLRRFDEQATARWMASLAVELKQEPTGKLFPVTDSARTVLDALMGRVRELGIVTRFGFRVAGVRRAENAWVIQSAPSEIITARRLIIATGGKALPKSGSDGAGYAWLQRIGHTIVPPVPALAPLVLDERGVDGSPLSRHFAELSGLTINARLSFAENAATRAPIASFDGSLLFTHFGLSGPAAMNLSRHIARYRQEAGQGGKSSRTGGNSSDVGVLIIGFELPGEAGFAQSVEAVDAWLKQAADESPRAGVAGLLARAMPERLAQMLASAVPAQRLADLTKTQRRHLAQLIHGSPLAVKGDRGFSFAEATAGGVALDEINWRTMQSRKAPGLHLCGEVLDVDGRIGGFNFQWAWASGYIAGSAAVIN